MLEKSLLDYRLDVITPALTSLHCAYCFLGQRGEQMVETTVCKNRYIYIKIACIWFAVFDTVKIVSLCIYLLCPRRER